MKAILMALAVSLLFCSACAAKQKFTDVACYGRSVKDGRDWIAVEFIDSTGNKHVLDGLGSSFSPVMRLAIKRGEVFAQTWGTELLPAQVRIVSGDVQVEPRYLDWLGNTDPIGLAAKQVAPYAGQSVIHKVDFTDACVSADPLVIEILETKGRVPRLLGKVIMRSGR